jgi:hypothetical protein
MKNDEKIDSTWFFVYSKTQFEKLHGFIHMVSNFYKKKLQNIYPI